MLSTERHFTADATHQFRTGLTGISMRFEILAQHAQARGRRPKPRPGWPRRISSTRRSTNCSGGGQHDPGTNGVRSRHRRRRPRRRMEPAVRRGAALDRRRHDGDFTAVVGTKGLAGQVIDILIDNALRHGRGSVTLLVEDTSVTVIDQGPGISDEAVSRCSRDPTTRRPDTAAACRSPGGWHRSTGAASTSPRHGRCVSVTGSCGRDRPGPAAVITAGETGPENQSPPPGGGNPGGGERKETPAVCTRLCSR